MMKVPRRRFQRMLLSILAVGLTGCEQCGDAGGVASTALDLPDATDAAPAIPASAEVTGPLPKVIYKRALERARKEISANGAHQRLEKLDEQIEREKETLR